MATAGSPSRARSADPGARREPVTLGGSPTWEQDTDDFLRALPSDSPKRDFFSVTGTTTTPTFSSPDRFAGASPSGSSPGGLSPSSRPAHPFFSKACSYYSDADGTLALPTDLTESLAFTLAMQREGVNLADFGLASTLTKRRQLYLLACVLQEYDQILLARPSSLDDYYVGYSYPYYRHHVWRMEEERKAADARLELDAIERRRQHEIAELQAKIDQERQLRLQRWRTEEDEAARRRAQLLAEREAARMREIERVEAARRREVQRLAEEAARLREAQRLADERAAAERLRRQREADEALAALRLEEDRRTAERLRRQKEADAAAAALRVAQEEEDRRRRQRALDLEVERIRLEREREAALRRLRVEVVDRVVEYQHYVPAHYVPRVRSSSYYYYPSYAVPVVRSSVEYIYP